MKNISKDKLKKYERSFNQNENKVITNAVTKNGFFKSCENYDEIRNARYEFSVNLKQGNITNQKQSGRCWIFASTNFLRYFLIKKLNINTPLNNHQVFVINILKRIYLEYLFQKIIMVFHFVLTSFFDSLNYIL